MKRVMEPPLIKTPQGKWELVWSCVWWLISLCGCVSDSTIQIHYTGFINREKLLLNRCLVNTAIDRLDCVISWLMWPMTTIYACFTSVLNVGPLILYWKWDMVPVGMDQFNASFWLSGKLLTFRWWLFSFIVFFFFLNVCWNSPSSECSYFSSSLLADKFELDSPASCQSVSDCLPFSRLWKVSCPGSGRAPPSNNTSLHILHIHTCMHTCKMPTFHLTDELPAALPPANSLSLSFLTCAASISLRCI